MSFVHLSTGISIVLMFIASMVFRPEEAKFHHSKAWTPLNVFALFASFGIVFFSYTGFMLFFASFLFIFLTCSFSDLKDRLASRWVLRIAYVSHVILVGLIDPHLLGAAITLTLLCVVLFFVPGFGASDARLVMAFAPLLTLGYSALTPFLFFILGFIFALVTVWFISGKGRTVPFIPVMGFAILVGLLPLIVKL